MSRVAGSVLLVGSVPGNNAQAVMDSCAKGLGDSLFALPDGETGYRRGWINFLAAKTYAVSEQLESITRPVDFVHMPVPRNRHDDGYFAPLAELAITDTKLFLGLVHHTDGMRGTLKRLETARKHASGFGIATECGFGRRPPETIPELMRIHREAVACL